MQTVKTFLAVALQSRAQLLLEAAHDGVRIIVQFSPLGFSAQHAGVAPFVRLFCTCTKDIGKQLKTRMKESTVIRDFEPNDADQIVTILKLNGQYGFPEVDGPEAMIRVKACAAAVFLVFEMDGKVVGVIRGTYDGSRAMIHQLSVHPTHQRKGIGRALVEEAANRFKEKGAPTVSATVTDRSFPFFQKVGFRKIDVFLVGNW